MVTTCVCMLGGRRAEQRNDGFWPHFFLEENCPSIPYPLARPFGSSPCVPGSFWAAVPALELRVSESVSKYMHRPFKRNTWESSRPQSHSAAISTCFHSLKLWGLLSLSLELRAGEPGMELGLLALQTKISLLILNWHTWEWEQTFCVSSLPTNLNVAFSIYPYRTSL